MSEPFTQLLSSLKLPTRAFAAVAVAALAVLLMPEEWLKWLGIAWLKETPVPGVAIVISFAFLGVDATRSALVWNKQRREAGLKEQAREAAAEAERERGRRELQEREAEAAARLEKGLEFLGRMTNSERHFCRKFIEKSARTQWLNMEHGTVTELVRRGVIYQSNQHAHVDLDFQAWGAYFTMHDWAWDHLHENPELVAEKVK